jgi:hypothetical protein
MPRPTLPTSRRIENIASIIDDLWSLRAPCPSVCPAARASRFIACVGVGATTPRASRLTPVHRSKQRSQKSKFAQLAHL